MNNRYRGGADERAELRSATLSDLALEPSEDPFRDLMEGPSAQVLELLTLQNTRPTIDLRAAVAAAQAAIDAGGIDYWPERATRNKDALAEAQRHLARGEQRDELAKTCPCLGAGGFPPIMNGGRGMWQFREFCSCNVGKQAELVYRSARSQLEVDNAASQQRLEEGYRKDRLERFASDIPPHFAEMTLDTYPATTAAQRKVLEQVRTWAETLAPDRPFLFIHGAYGCGKSGLSIAAARKRIELGITRKAIFTAVPDLLDRLRATFDRESAHEREADVMGKLRDADLLILDDVGAENTTAWAVERLFVLLNDRHGNHADTIITSNLDGRGLAGKLGERTMWRIAELAQVVPMDGCANLRARSRARLEVVNG